MSEGCGQILHSFFVIEWKRRKGTDVEKVTGYVEHIVFRNEENGYTVFHLENEDGEVTCVGNLNFITEGEMLELEGEYVNHSVYGNQLKVSAYCVKEPEDLVSIERYLGSGAIKGIGQTMASRIVKKFREDTFRIIEEEPERLAEIKGISEREGDGDRFADGRKKGYEKIHDLSAKIWNFDQACSKDLSTVWNEGASNSGGKPISACR